ncbi:MAG: PQQ-binding-like beta-propeller repeat protein [Gemmatimonadetes bacterium]|nr:PQQ-binding-like beta-propeller repeat protein [Gemmatimonadota bacterium]
MRPAPVEPTTVWPMYLGELTRSPYEDETAPADTPQEVWRTEVGRGLRAPPVVTGPVVLVGTTNRIVTAVSAETGEIFWEHRLGGALTVPPLVDSDRIFVALDAEDGAVYALRLRDGRAIWKRNMPAVRRAPLLSEDVLYVGTETGRFLALAADDGEVVWDVELGVGSASTPVAWGGHLLVATGRDSLIALEAGDGRVRERIALPGEVSAPPALVGDTLVVPFHRGELLALELSPADSGRRGGVNGSRRAAAQPRELWRARLGAPILAAPVAAGDGRVYALGRDGTVWAVARRNGEATRLTSLGSAATMSLALVGRTLLVGLLDGRLVAVDAGTGETRWSVRFGESVSAPVAVYSGDVFVPLLRGSIVKLR